MGVYIRGMKMPKNCNDCPLAGDFKCNLMPSIPALCKEYDMAVQNGKRLNNCPLVPVPPHGRLIDADALIDSFDPSDFWNPDAEDNCFAAIHVVNCAPTIIPEEEK